MLRSARMEKRSAARELAFLAIFQLPDKKIAKLAETDIHAICLSAIRSLADYSNDNLKQAESFFIKTERLLMEHQINHPDNEQYGEPRPVAVPTTEDFFDQLNNCYEAISLLKESLRIPEIYLHYKDKTVEEFVLQLVQNLVLKLEEADKTIAEVSKSWDFSRIRKADKWILRMAVSEMLATDLQHKVIVSEALKLANKYGSKESTKFINGVLADVIKTIST